MPKPKLYEQLCSVKLPKDLNRSIRAASVMTGKSISELIRESLRIVWEKRDDLAERLPQVGTV